MPTRSSNGGIEATGLVLTETDGIRGFMNWNLTGGLTLGQRLSERLLVGAWEFRSLVPIGTSKERAGWSLVRRL